jgi:hypothetical protein
MSSQTGGKPASPIIVGISAWLMPGLGYWLIGQRWRGITVLVSIMVLFILGVLIGGIRVVDPPGYGQYGYQAQLVEREGKDRTEIVRIDPSSPAEEDRPGSRNDRPIGWALTNSPTQFFSEIGNKPWFIGQILCGPISLAMSSVSIHEAHPVLDAHGNFVKTSSGALQEAVPASHSRSWEIGTLYTAVAGMLNLLAIIDSVYRAGQPEEQ